MASSKLSLAFRIYKHDQLIREARLTQGVIKIGKVPSAHLMIDDESVSRMHAIIEVTGGEVSIVDLGSTRGTLVNGRKVTKARLSSGDSIAVGDVRVEVVFHDSAAETLYVAPELAARPLDRAPDPAVFQAAIAESAEEPGGARAVEVAAMFGDSVIGVKHCIDPRGGKVASATWGVLGAGIALLAASAIAFYVSIDTAATNRAGLDHHTRVLHKPAYSYRPHQLGLAVDWIAFGGLALGLAGVAAGLARVHRERQSPFYRIGTAPGVEQPVEQAPSPSFPLVAPVGDAFVLNYAPGIDGELVAGGQTTPLSELAASGLARPSASVPGALELPIPPRARIRARAGQTTFLVSSVPAPRRQAAGLFAGFERRTLGYVGGSLAAHLGIWMLLQQIPIADAGVSLDLGSLESTTTRAATTAVEDVPPEPTESSGNQDDGEANRGAPSMAIEGQAGRPDAADAQGRMRIKDNHAPPQLSREQAIEQARTAGFLGSSEVLRGGIASLTSQMSFSSGFDDASIYGAVFGADGEGRGNFGLGRHGFGPGSGCAGEGCGIIGTGRYGTIGDGPGAGQGWRGGQGDGWPGRRQQIVPTVRISGPSNVTDGLDRAIIKRYVMRNLQKVKYCYERELLSRSDLAGTVTVQFMINAMGSVSASTGSGLDPSVASCVADVVKNIQFPKPSNGGSVQVNYPFTFRAPGVR